MSHYSTRSLDALLDQLHQVWDTRAYKHLRRLRPALFKLSYEELRAIPPIWICLDESPTGKQIRRLIGRGPKASLVWAMEVPETTDQFLASHERANNLRKALRKADHDGISCVIVEDEGERDHVLCAVHSDWSLNGFLPNDPFYHRQNSDWQLGTVIVARNSDGLPLAAGIVLQSATTAMLSHLVVGRSHSHRSRIRYALNAFAVKVAIESGARMLMLSGAYVSTRQGIRALAINTGYRPRRAIIQVSG